MKIVSFNVNGIRARIHQIKQVIDRHNPDVIGLQEIKVHDSEFPLKQMEALGYRAYYHGQKGHYGVALLSKNEASEIEKGFPYDEENSQRRLIKGKFNIGGENIVIINGYFPQGESRNHEIKFPAKEKFYSDLLKFLNENHSSDEKIILMGDMNIAPEDNDIGIGENNVKRWLQTGKCSFLPEERIWLNKIFDWGFEDIFRKLYPNEQNIFSWFDYRSKGFEKEPRRGLRIDLILGTKSISKLSKKVEIDYNIRASEKPSDHCPVIAEFL